MATKLYPTLSAFYKAGHVEYGSEQDAFLCRVPEEKLYRRPSRQRPVLHIRPETSAPDQSSQPEPPATNTTVESPRSPLNFAGDSPAHENAAGGHETGQLTPSAPPLLEMLDSRLQEYLDSLLEESHNVHVSLPQPTQDATSASSNTHGQRNDVTLALPPNLGTVEEEELQPDYDDLELSPEQLADEILNNLDLGGGGDNKDCQKSLNLLRGLGLDLSQPAQRPHKTQHQNSVISNEGNESPVLRSDNHERRHQARSNSHMPNHDRTRRQEQVKRSAQYGQIGASNSLAEQENEHPQDRVSAARQRFRPDRLTTPVQATQPGHRDRRQTEKHGLASDVPKISRQVSGTTSDYNAWMTWRKQVNRQLATVILLKQNGKHVNVQNTDMRRKPLRQSSIDFVSQLATQSGSTTSLGGKPYVMYGIPRASLLSSAHSSVDLNQVR